MSEPAKNPAPIFGALAGVPELFTFPSACAFGVPGWLFDVPPNVHA